MTMKRMILFAAAAIVASTAFAQDAEKLSIKVSGRGYVDGTVVLQNDEEHVASGATISDLRIGVSGKYQNWSAKIDLGYAKKSVSFKDVYLQYNFKKQNYARIGHYAEPIGLDYMESSGNIKFVDAGIVMQTFSPGRRLGVEYMAWGKGLWFAAGAFADANFAKQRTESSADDGYSLTARVAYAPVHEDGKIFHLGVAGSFRKPTAGTYGPSTVDNHHQDSYGHGLGTPVTSAKYNSVSIDHAKNNVRVAGEVIAALDRVAVQGEYIYSNTTRTLDNLNSFSGYGAYAQAGIMLVGAPYSYSQSWARLALPKPGSVELAARFSHVNLQDDDAGFTSHSFTTNKGLTLDGVGYITNQLTVGLNYYYKPFLRFKLDYDNQHVKGMKSFNFITARAQFFF